MPKMIKKSKCQFEAGHITKKNELVGIPAVVHMQLDKLEIMLQQAEYLENQPVGTPAPSLDGFVRKTTLTSDRPYVEMPSTPVTDKRVAEAMQFMAEADAVNDTATINRTIDEFGALIDWCAADKFVEGQDTSAIDLYILGNPLELTPDKIAGYISGLVLAPAIDMEL